MKKITKTIIISGLFAILLTIPVLASNYNTLADFGCDHGNPEQDGVVDFEDLMIFSQAYGSTPSDPNWNPACDICGQGSSDPDGQVDFEDLMPLAESFGEREEKEWTVMFYMCGDDAELWGYYPDPLLERYGWAQLRLLEDAFNESPSNQVNIIAQFDPYSGSTYRYVVTGANKGITEPNYKDDIVAKLPEVSMGNESSFSSFLTWAETFPARHYMLVVFGHGMGWRGIVTDDDGVNTSFPNYLALDEFTGGLSSTSIDFDIIYLNSCLMQMTEVAYEIGTNLAGKIPNYLIASEATSCRLFVNYKEFFQPLLEDPQMSPRDICKNIIDNYDVWGGSIKPSTLSVINLPLFMTLNAEQIINSFAEALLASLKQVDIVEAKINTQMYNEVYPGYKDLYDFAERISNIPGIECQSQATAVMNFIEQVIDADLEVHQGSEVDRSHGLSIYLLDDGEDYSTSYDYIQLATDTSWDEFIQRQDRVDDVKTVAVTEYQAGSVINAVKISWDTYEGATGYRIDRTVDGFNYESFETTETTYYDQAAQEGTGYIYYVTASGPFGSTLPSEVNIIEPKYLPSCSLISPPHDPDSNQPINDTNPEFRWDPINISLPYGAITKINSDIFVKDLTDGYSWSDAIFDYTNDSIIYDGALLEDGHEYRWYIRFRGYNEDNNIISYSKSQEWQFTYEEIGNVEKIEPPVEIIGLLAITGHDTVLFKLRTVEDSVYQGTNTIESEYFRIVDGGFISRGNIVNMLGVRWKAYIGATGYKVFRKIDNSDFVLWYDWPLTAPESNSSSWYGVYGYCNISIESTYSYYVVAYNQNENWETVNGITLSKTVDNETFLPAIYLNSPINNVQIEGNQIEFTWTPAGDILPYGEMVSGRTHLTITEEGVSYPKYWFTFEDFTTNHFIMNLSEYSLEAGKNYSWMISSHGYNSIDDVFGIAVTSSESWEFTYTGASVESPTVTTLEAYTITKTAATLWGEIVSTGGLTVTRRGFEYKDSAGGSTFDWHEDGDWPANDYIHRITNLVAGHTYLYRAYAVNDQGTGYGAWESFKTTEEIITSPSLTTVGADNIQETSIRFKGRIDDTGGEDADWRGFRIEDTVTGWIYSPRQESGPYGTGDYYITYITLSPGHTYKYKASAHNSAGTSYGTEKSVTTQVSKQLTSIESSISSVSLRWPQMLMDNEYDITAYYSDGSSADIWHINCTWSSSKPNSVHVNEGGIITPLVKTADFAVVTMEYTEEGITKSDTIAVTVLPYP